MSVIKFKTSSVLNKLILLISNDTLKLMVVKQGFVLFWKAALVQDDLKRSIFIVCMHHMYIF